MIHIRPQGAEDAAFVLDSWRKAQQAAQRAHVESATPFDLNYARLALHQGSCLVAVADADRDVIVGWALARGRTLEYVYVKYDARRLGVARDLIVTLGDIYHYAATSQPWTRTWVEKKHGGGLK